MIVEGLGSIEFHEANEIIVASDPKAKRDVSYVRRMPARTVQLLSKRVGPSGTLWSLREVRANGPEWRYLAEGETLAELSANLVVRKREEFCATIAILDHFLFSVSVNFCSPVSQASTRSHASPKGRAVQLRPQ